jgi:hypothetical protein
LREAVQQAVASGETSMSDIAIRCGRFRRDGKGRVGGETTWLARRIGQTADSTTGRVSPWVQSDVLALIARKGLRLAPVEVEVQ